MINCEFPTDPIEFLAYLQAEQFTPDQESYLRSDALAQYEAAIWADLASGRTNQDISSLAQEIAAVWRAWLTANPVSAVPTTRDLFED